MNDVNSRLVLLELRRIGEKTFESEKPRHTYTLIEDNARWDNDAYLMDGDGNVLRLVNTYNLAKLLNLSSCSDDVTEVYCLRENGE